MNKEQLQFFYDEIMGLFGWGDEEEETGVDPLTWAREQLAQIRKDVVTWKNAERLALETAAKLQAERETEKRAYIQYQSYDVALRAELDALRNPNAVNCDGLPQTPHTPIAIIRGTPCPACSAKDELAAKDAALEGVSNWATAWLSAHSQEEK